MNPNETPLPSPFEQRTEATMLLLLARIRALEEALMAVAGRCGLDAGDVRTLLSSLACNIHQLLLEQIETVDPTKAAALDRRPGIPDLDPEMLKLLAALRLRHPPE